jgi:hypothetical protein
MGRTKYVLPHVARDYISLIERDRAVEQSRRQATYEVGQL